MLSRPSRSLLTTLLGLPLAVIAADPAVEPLPAVPVERAVEAAAKPVAPLAAPGEGAAKPAATSADAAQPDRTGWPTEAEAKAAILRVEYPIYASDTKKSMWNVKDFRHEVKSIKFAAKPIQKQMTFGVTGTLVYPVKIVYTQITDYDGKPTTRVEAGTDGVWFLYRDSFGDWTGKYGHE